MLVEPEIWERVDSENSGVAEMTADPREERVQLRWGQMLDQIPGHGQIILAVNKRGTDIGQHELHLEQKAIFAVETTPRQLDGALRVVHGSDFATRFGELVGKFTPAASKIEHPLCVLEAGDVQESSEPRVSRYFAPEAIKVLESSTIGCEIMPVVMLPNIPALLRLMSRGKHGRVSDAAEVWHSHDANDPRPKVVFLPGIVPAAPVK